MEWARNRGRERNIFALKHKLKNERFDDSRSDEEINIEGVMGELGYCKILHREPEDVIRIGVDRKYDDKMNGKRIQIKSTRHKNVYLFANDYLLSNYDFMVRMLVDPPLIRAIGYISTPEFSRIKKFDPRGLHRLAYSVHHSQLSYIFLLPLHTMYGDRWFDWWISGFEGKMENENEVRKKRLQDYEKWLAGLTPEQAKIRDKNEGRETPIEWR